MKTPKLHYIQRKDKTYAIWPYLVGKGFVRNQDIYGPHELREVFWCGHQDMMFFCESESLELTGMTDKLSEYIYENPKHAVDIKRKFIKNSKDLIRFTKKAQKTNFSKMHSSELIAVFKEFEEIYTRCYSYGEPLPLLSKELPEKVKKHFIDDLQGTDEDFDKLITPVELNFIQQEMLDMLKIKEEKADMMNVRQKIQKHAEKYGWIPFDYGAYTYDYKHFENEYSAFDIKKHRYIKTYSEDMKKEIVQLEDIYNLDRKDKLRFEAIRISSFLMNYKKELFTKLHFYFNPFFIEISKRLNIKLPIAKSIFPHELKSILDNPQEELKKAYDRYDYNYMISKSDGIDELRGEDAKHIFNKIIPKNL